MKNHLYFCSQTGDEDVSQFDSKFTKQTPIDSPVDSMLSESADKIFQVINRRFDQVRGPVRC